ncbi:hypothetical protein FRC07_009752 [Ceratobasidium sp. 392]|nr:hypothetical protein FRC07_009752 [Ceratobasidium sp. 392]
MPTMPGTARHGHSPGVGQPKHATFGDLLPAKRMSTITSRTPILPQSTPASRTARHEDPGYKERDRRFPGSGHASRMEAEKSGTKGVARATASGRSIRVGKREAKKSRASGGRRAFGRVYDLGRAGSCRFGCRGRFREEQIRDDKHEDRDERAIDVKRPKRPCTDTSDTTESALSTDAAEATTPPAISPPRF